MANWVIHTPWKLKVHWIAKFRLHDFLLRHRSRWWDDMDEWIQFQSKLNKFVVYNCWVERESFENDDRQTVQVTLENEIPKTINVVCLAKRKFISFQRLMPLKMLRRIIKLAQIFLFCFLLLKITLQSHHQHARSSKQLSVSERHGWVAKTKEHSFCWINTRVASVLLVYYLLCVVVVAH